MNKEKFILQEEINRMKKLATYDKSKTLTENKEFINEQTTYYYDNAFFLKKLEGPLAIPPGGILASKMYPSLKPEQYPNKVGEPPLVTQTAQPAQVVGPTASRFNLSQALGAASAAAVTPPAKKPPLKVAGQSTPNTTESSIGVIYQYEYPKDTKYRYGVKDKKWFGKNLANGREFDLSTITTTIANLNRQFPNAMTQVEEPPAAPPAAPPAPAPAAPAAATATTPITPKKLTDMGKIELDNMKKNQPLAFDSAYNKLNAFEKTQVDKTYANK